MIEICGDRVVSEYRTTDAGRVRDALIANGLNVASVKRSFATFEIPTGFFQNFFKRHYALSRLQLNLACDHWINSPKLNT